MAGTIEVRADTRWSAASWLFYWVLDDLSETVHDPTTVGKLEEIVREHLPWLGLKELPHDGRVEVLDALCRSLVDHADHKMPADLANRDGVLRHLQELAQLACETSKPSVDSD